MATLLAPTAAQAASGNDQVKQVERKISSIKRGIATSPSKAEQDLLQARELLAELEQSEPDNKKLPQLQKNIETLGQQLEKRLGRPIGGSAPEPKKSSAPVKQATLPSSLPSSVSSRIKKIDGYLDAVETALAKDQLQTATSRLNSAQKVMDEIQSRYSSKIPAGNEEMKVATERLSAVTQQHNQAAAAAASESANQAANQQKKEAQSQEWIEKFAPFNDRKSDSYLLMGSSFNSASEAEQKKSRAAYAKANSLLAEYQTTDFPYGKTQELEFLLPGLIDKLKYFNADESSAQQAEANSEWVEKLRAYNDVGAGSRKYLVAGVTKNGDQIKQREALFNEAQAVWADYQKAEFPLGKTTELINLEKEMQQKLAEMPDVLRKSRILVAAELEGDIDRVFANLNKDTDWKSDTSKKPSIAMQRDIEPLRNALQSYAGLVEPTDASLLKMQKKIADIEQLDQKNRSIRAERTFMEADRFSGKGAEDMKNKVRDIVKQKIPGAKLLRVTLRAEAWQEESVTEWTDTTKTASRYRVTRFMTAHAAAKSGDGKVYLHGVHLASDRTGDGSWGPLYGNIKWSDWMAEENVNK
ncbi:MAG: hypothetical protein H8E21_11860 [Gammaproteobacteria bacterium]|nr:hypothetical protein [Gammaproteobacteria bacterium]MBL6998921.1 hypothetical protein [Gammaproteobacteria bacterium]